MHNKQYQVFFLLIVSFLLIVLGVGYFVFNNEEGGVDVSRSDDEKQEGDYKEGLPPGLVEGVIYEVDFSNHFIIVDVTEPQEIAEERIEVSFDTERTKFVELLLEVRGPDDVRDRGRQSLDYTLLSRGDEVLVELGGLAVEAIQKEDDLSAQTITLITAEEF